MSDAAARALRAALGEEAVQEREPLPVEGVRPGLALRPTSEEAMAEAVTTLGRNQLAALVRGGGSRLGTANPVRRADVLLETTGLAREPQVDAEEGVAFAQAGVALEHLCQRVREARWELPLDPPGPGSTLGGALAAAAIGPGSPQPRDLVLGLGVVLGSGERTRCGGRVVKNVTGYDLAKLYVGSFGCLGVITGAWLSLHPEPELRRALEAPLPEGAAGFEVALAASRRPSVRVAALLDGALLDPPLEGRQLVLELAGDAGVVAEDRQQLTHQLPESRPVDLERVDQLRRIQAEAGGLRVRVAVVASRGAAAFQPLARLGARLLAYPGKGLLYALLPAETPGGALASALAEAARRGGGPARLEAAPLALRQQLDVFQPPEALVPLYRALKQQFDPKGVLNPGRFAARL